MRTHHALGVLAFLAFSGMVHASVVDVTVSASKSSMGVGETATLTVYGQVKPAYATSGNGIFGWDVDLRIGDPTILGLLPATLDRSGWMNNPSTSSSGTGKSWGLDAIYDTGESSSTLGLTGPIKLFSIDFRVLKAGTTTLAVEPDATTGTDFLTWLGNSGGDYSRASITIGVPATLLWTGSIDNKWNVGQTANWSAGGAAGVYREGDHVVFDDTGTHTLPINVTATVNPGSLLVNNSATDVVLGGIGSVAGPCKLTKTGNSTLTLTGNNTYTGGTAVTSGTLIAAAMSALGSGAVSLGGTVGSNNASLLIDGNYTLSAPVTVQDDGSLTSLRTMGGDSAGEAAFSGDITVRKALALTAAAGGTVRFSGVLDNPEGHTIMKVGDGIVILDGFQMQGPGALLDVDAGTVLLNSDAGSGTSANLSITVTDAIVNFGSDQHLDTLDIGPGGKVAFTGARVVVLNHLMMSGFDFGAMTLTPEPATLALLAVGGALAFWRRRGRWIPRACGSRLQPPGLPDRGR